MDHIKLYKEFKEVSIEDETQVDEALEDGVTNLVTKDTYRIYTRDGKVFSSGARYEGRDAKGEKFTRLNVPHPNPFWIDADTMMKDYVFYKTGK